jgi:DNA polymerase III subunit delta'
MQALRQMCSEAYLPPFEARYKVFIIHEADRMLSYSSNALLKTFEEPPLHTKIILLTHSQTALLPTIRSRCAPFFFEAISQSVIEEYLKTHYQAEEKALKSWASLAQGSIGRAVQLAKRGGDPNRTLLLNALSNGKFEDFKSLAGLVQQLAEEIESGRKLLEDEVKEVHKEASENFSAWQKGALEKEIEGVSAMALVQEATALFGTLLSWYRDLSLLQSGGERRYLINLDYEEALEQALQIGQGLPL